MSQTEETAVYDPMGFMDPAVSADPQPFYRLARETGAVVPGAFGPQIVRRAAADYALQHPEDFSSGMGSVDLGQSVPLIPLQVDPPEHRNYRRLLDPIFAPRQMNALEPEIARLVNERIDSFIERGRVRLRFRVGRAPSLLGVPGPGGAAVVPTRSVSQHEGRHPAAGG